MTPRTLEATVTALSAASRRAAWSPWSDLAWPQEIVDDTWCFTPELVSLHGTRAWSGLDDHARRALARAEAVNFFSLNVHGERILMEGIVRRLYHPDFAHLAPYLHHFLDEENRHSVAFAEFCTRYASGVYPDRKFALQPPRVAAEENFLFFARVVLFEEIVDAYNVAIAADGRVEPIVRDINRRHHEDESRHLAFGRQVVAELVDATWSAEKREDLAMALSDFLISSWREYANPTAYRDAGLDDVFSLRRQAWHADDFTSRREEMSAKPVAFLRELGFDVVVRP